MRAVVQRVRGATLCVDGELISKIGAGLVVFLGVGKGDDLAETDKMSKKLADLRIFEDDNGKMNLSVRDVGGEILLVSQFTLYGDTSHGNRPSFTEAELPTSAKLLYERAARNLSAMDISVKLGVFGADMKITQENDGPVTIFVEISNKK